MSQDARTQASTGKRHGKPGLSLAATGVAYHPRTLDASAQLTLVSALVDMVAEAPLFQPVMPRTGKPLSVMMTNCGALGWFADRAGYRYVTRHPVTGAPWPPIPPVLIDLWKRFQALQRHPRPA